MVSSILNTICEQRAKDVAAAKVCPRAARPPQPQETTQRPAAAVAPLEPFRGRAAGR